MQEIQKISDCHLGTTPPNLPAAMRLQIKSAITLTLTSGVKKLFAKCMCIGHTGPAGISPSTRFAAEGKRELQPSPFIWCRGGWAREEVLQAPICTHLPDWKGCRAWMWVTGGQAAWLGCGQPPKLQAGIHLSAKC